MNTGETTHLLIRGKYAYQRAESRSNSIGLRWAILDSVDHGPWTLVASHDHVNNKPVQTGAVSVMFVATP
jgi:hypothetical protein